MNRNQTLVVMLLMVWAVSVAAQITTNLPGASDPGPVSDEAVKSFLTKYSWLKLVMVPLVTLSIMGLKHVVGFIPVQLWPVIAPVLGAGMDYLAAKAGVWTGNPVVGGLVGAAAVWLHQVGVQGKELKNEGPTRSDAPQEDK